MPNARTLKNKIHHYISKKQDVCCENDLDRNVVVQQILDKYKTISKLANEPEEYLSFLNNDLLVFIGYKVDLKTHHDTEGVALWNQMDKRMYENKRINEQKIIRLLKDVPLYLLLACLGYASYKEQRQ
jgi:hypothetical protein